MFTGLPHTGLQVTWCFTPSQPVRLYQGEGLEEFTSYHHTLSAGLHLSQIILQTTIPLLYRHFILSSKHFYRPVTFYIMAWSAVSKAADKTSSVRQKIWLEKQSGLRTASSTVGVLKSGYTFPNTRKVEKES